MDIPGHKRCRSCLREFPLKVLHPLAVERTASLFKLTSISFDADDQMPQQICNKCYSHCLKWNEFRLMAISSANVLHAERELDVIHGTESDDDVIFSINSVDNDEEYFEIHDPEVHSSEAMEEEEGHIPIDSPTPGVEADDSDGDYYPEKDAESSDEGEKPDDPLICDVCEKRCKTKKTLKYHKLTHNREKMEHSCNICKKRFRDKSNLEDHSRIHTGERPFNCSVCEKSFTCKDYLKQHHRIHSGETPYKCAICTKSFARSSTLNKHLRTHKSKDNQDQQPQSDSK